MNDLPTSDPLFDDPCAGDAHCCCCGPGEPCCDCGEIMPPRVVNDGGEVVHRPLDGTATDDAT